MKLEINKYESMTHDEEIKYLLRCLDETTSEEILRIAGVFEIVKEHFNDEMLGTGLKI